jgi:GH18 family chitinase
MFILICFNVSKFIHLFCSWEYPNNQGLGCNIVSADDSANFLSFLQTLRKQNGAKNLIISAAVSVTPFVGSDGNPMTDVSGFAKVLDYIGSPFTNLSFCARLTCNTVQRL